MKVLVIGSGGREHAIVWKCLQSPKVEKVYCCPGNGGIEDCVNLNGFEEQVKFVKEKGIDLVIVGPEVPLVEGIVDYFEKQGCRIFGPNKKAAQIEGSKSFCKKIMEKYGVPTAKYKLFTDYNSAFDYLRKVDFPIVIKADGLAAGKAVFVVKNFSEADAALRNCFIDRIFGKAGDKVIIEEALTGSEVSYLAITDGSTIVPLVTSQDHKRIFDNDEGPNTGGMGAYSPANLGIDEEQIREEILDKMISGLRQEGIIYKGVIYAGLMITEDGPKVLEFNCRFGDPETQVILPRMKTDLIETILETIEGGLQQEIEWNKEYCVCVVLASEGYPGSYKKGDEIKGLEYFEGKTNELLFHAGTKKEGEKIYTSGGRVLNVVSFGSDIKQAIQNTYNAVSRVYFRGMHYRKDIGSKGIKNEVKA